MGEERTGSRVRAILLEDGAGSVEMAEAAPPIDQEELKARYDAIMSFLGRSRALGEETFYLIQLCVKFWFANSLGKLVVFPPSFASMAVHDLIQSGSRQDWKKSSESLAFFLPRVNQKNTGGRRAKFGSRLAREVHLGGGPFVLEDSPDLVEKAMRRMGYLDDAFNADLDEALFCFLNTAGNKTTLRKLTMLPNSGDRSEAVQAILKTAFLTNRASGQWWKLGTGRGHFALNALRGERLVSTGPSSSCSTAELFEAMKVYAQRHGLPPMRTFNGLVRRIQQEVDREPSTRSLIEVGHVGPKARPLKAV